MLKKKDIKDLTGLEKATSLRVLELQKNQISDITPISGLTQLTYVEFWTIKSVILHHLQD